MRLREGITSASAEYTLTIQAEGRKFGGIGCQLVTKSFSSNDSGVVGGLSSIVTRNLVDLLKLGTEEERIDLK